MCLLHNNSGWNDRHIFLRFHTICVGKESIRQRKFQRNLKITFAHSKNKYQKVVSPQSMDERKTCMLFLFLILQSQLRFESCDQFPHPTVFLLKFLLNHPVMQKTPIRHKVRGTGRVIRHKLSKTKLCNEPSR